MISAITHTIPYVFLFILGWATESFIFSAISALVFIYQVVKTERQRPTIFYANIFINAGLIMFAMSCLLIDTIPNFYLQEINRLTSYESITAFYLAIISPTFALVNRQIGMPRISGKFIGLRVNLFQWMKVGTWFLFIALITLILQLYLKKGFPIAEGLHRIIFYQQLDPYEINLFVLLSLFSALFGFLHAQANSKANTIALIVILLMRIMAMQKFTELALDISLFLLFAKSNSIYHVTKNISGHKFAWIYKLTIILMSVIIVSALTLYSYDNKVDIFLERIMAQAQLSFAYVQNGVNLIPNMNYLPNEFKNFMGSQALRLELFSRGEYYGIFTLMNASDTGRNLSLQAEEMTSSSGSYPAIYLYLFGVPLGYIISLITAYVLIAVNNLIISLAHETRNPLFVVLGFLVIIRTLKFFVTGSPSHVFNIQYLLYLTLLTALAKLHYRPIYSRRIHI